SWSLQTAQAPINSSGLLLHERCTSVQRSRPRSSRVCRPSEKFTHETAAIIADGFFHPNVYQLFPGGRISPSCLRWVTALYCSRVSASSMTTLARRLDPLQVPLLRPEAHPKPILVPPPPPVEPG